MLPCEILELLVRKTHTRELLILAVSNEFRYSARSELKSRKLDFIEKQQKERKIKVLREIKRRSEPTPVLHIWGPSCVKRVSLFCSIGKTTKRTQNQSVATN